jgi:phage anti-repressor protein
MARASAETVNEIIAYVNDLNGEDGEQFFHPSITETIIRAIVNNRDFVISVEQLAEWLGQRTDNIHRFVKHFKEGIDYKYIIPSVVRAHTRKDAGCYCMLSMDCAKRLALRSRGRQADMVRSYFIKMEAAYRDYLSGAIRNRLRGEDPNVTQAKQSREEPRQRKRVAKGPGMYVYGNENGYKIGSTADFEQNRYPFLRRVVPGELKHWEPFRDERLLEDCLHAALEGDAVGHEIFRSKYDDIMTALQVCKGRVGGIREEFERARKT